jgi:hypothetical protein
MNDPDFQFLQDLLRRRSGLSLTGEKRYLVERQAQRRSPEPIVSTGSPISSRACAAAGRRR